MPPLNQAFAKAYGAELAAYGGVATVAPPADIRAVTNRAAILPLSAATEAPPSPRPFQALLQIEHCLWPETVLRLASAGHLANLEAELAEIAAERRLVLGVASPAPASGVTTIVQALARRFGQRGLSIAVVDAHFARPQLAAGWQILPQLGWEHMLRGEMGLDEVLIESVGDRLAILPLKSPPEDLAELLASSRFELSLRMLRQNYAVTILDLGPIDPPLAAGLNALLATELIEAVALVHDARHADTPRLRAAHDAIASGNLRWTGVIENFVAESDEASGGRVASRAE